MRYSMQLILSIFKNKRKIYIVPTYFISLIIDLMLLLVVVEWL